uniref:Uncharacterized protein n=1 Tax=Medicago truncatula TaxID=3880 RepID=I3SCI6_MEDTR|nr:unknown [Medicago truncatula]
MKFPKKEFLPLGH